VNKLLSAALAAALVLPAGGAAQSANGTVGASATILAYLDVQKLADLDFGSINAGSAATLTPGTLPGAGSLGVLQLDHNAEVSLSVSLPAGGLTLVGGSGTEPKLPVSFECGYSTASSGALDAVAVSCSALPNRLGNDDGSARTSYIQIGGDIGAGDTTGRIPGTYTGQVVFTVTSVY